MIPTEACYLGWQQTLPARPAGRGAGAGLSGRQLGEKAAGRKARNAFDL